MPRRPARGSLPVMKTVAVYSLKGGVGKTTLAVNLAWCAATLSHRRSLLWDLDPQAAASWLLGAGGGDRAQAIFSRDVSVRKRAAPTTIERLDLIAADRSLRGLDQFLHDLAKRKRLARLLDDLADYDRVILDCPPGITETAEQVIRAADLVVVPVIPSPLSQRAFEEVAAHLGGRVPLLPVHAMVDRRRTLHAAALAAEPEWLTLPMASTVESMAARRAPVGAFAPRSAAAQAFATLWREVERRLAA